MVDDRIHPLPVGIDVFALLDDIADQDTMLAGCADPLPLAQVRLLAPVRPGAIRDFVTFEEHVEGVRRSVDGRHRRARAVVRRADVLLHQPVLVIGPADDVPVPPGCRGVRLRAGGRRRHRRHGRDLHRSRRATHIVGYTIFNDWSARDLQSAEMRVGLGPAKGKDTATTLGPVAGHRRRARAVPRRRRFLDLELRLGSTASASGTTVVAHGLDLRGDGRLRLPRDLGAPRRRARLGHLRQRRLPRRAVGTDGHTDPATAASPATSSR